MWPGSRLRVSVVFMRKRWMWGASLLTMLISACGNSAATPTGSGPPTSLRIGIAYSGGPAPGNSTQLEPGTIYLKGPGPKASKQVADGQTATFMVQPGHYTASARSGDGQCQDTKVTVGPAEAPSPSLVYCSVK